MRCPQCGERETRVVDSRDLDDSATIRRRRECAACATRFTTYERIEAARLVVVKRDGVRQEFDRDKLAAGLRKALTRRPVPDGAAEAAADAIEAELRAAGATEVPSSRIGALAMEKLRGDRPDRLHPVRQRLPELRGPRGSQARGRHPVREPRNPGGLTMGQGRGTDERPLRPRHPGRHRGRRRPDRPVRPDRPPAVVGRPPPRPQLPGLPQQPLPVHRRPRAAAGPDRAAADRGRRAVRPPPGRVRARPDARVGGAADRPRRPARGQSRRSAGSGCSSTRPPATSIRAGRATSRSS